MSRGGESVRGRRNSRCVLPSTLPEPHLSVARPLGALTIAPTEHSGTDGGARSRSGTPEGMSLRERAAPALRQRPETGDRIFDEPPRSLLLITRLFRAKRPS